MGGITTPKPPVQNFDATPLVRFRVRGTQGQVEAIHAIIGQLNRESALPFGAVQVQNSGPVGEGATQWAVAFYSVPTMAPQIKDLLFALGLEEET